MCGGTFFCTTSFVVAGFLLGLSPQEDLPRFIKPAHAAVLKQWLGTHQGLRVATDDDCAAPRRARCTGIAELRKSKPSYQPYYLSGDFNDDRIDDFAVVLIDPAKLIGNPALPDYAALSPCLMDHLWGKSRVPRSSRAVSIYSTVHSFSGHRGPGRTGC